MIFYTSQRINHLDRLAILSLVGVSNRFEHNKL